MDDLPRLPARPILADAIDAVAGTPTGRTAIRIGDVSHGMFRAILSEGQIVCERYERSDHGVELYDGDDQMVAFVPYSNLHTILDEETYESDERSIM